MRPMLQQVQKTSNKTMSPKEVRRSSKPTRGFKKGKEENELEGPAKEKGKNKKVNLNSLSTGISSNWKAFLEAQKKENPSKELKGKTEKLMSNLKGFKREKSKGLHKEGKNNFKSKNHQKDGSQTKDKGESLKDLIWFDDVDPELLQASLGVTHHKTQCGVLDQKFNGSEKSSLHEEKGENKTCQNGTNSNSQIVNNVCQLTKRLGLDCEMVGGGKDGSDHILARVSLVNSLGGVVIDKYVKPREQVTDYRTAVSGIRKEDIENGEDFVAVQSEVADLLKGRILVGHALHNDLKVLMLSHPKRDIRDTAQYRPLRKIAKTKRPSLKLLAKTVLGINIQDGEHSSVEDARATMKIYQRHKASWERDLKGRKTKSNTPTDESQQVYALLSSESVPEKSGRQRWLEKRKLRQERFRENNKKGKRYGKKR